VTADLAVWLLADDGPIAEDERRARELLRVAQQMLRDLADYVRSLGRVVPGWDSWPDVEHLCQDMLAECAAKRAIIEQCVSAIETHNDGSLAFGPSGLMTLPATVIHEVGQVYVGHSGWRGEWAVDVTLT
jgi:hypothetical protein